MQHVVGWVRKSTMVCLKVWVEYLLGSPNRGFGANVGVNYEYGRSIPSWEKGEKLLSILQQ